MRSVFIVSLLLLIGLPTRSEIDPSSALLLKGNRGRTSGRDAGLNSGRYTVRPRNENSPKGFDSGNDFSTKEMSPSSNPSTDSSSKASGGAAKEGAGPSSSTTSGTNLPDSNRTRMEARQGPQGQHEGDGVEPQDGESMSPSSVHSDGSEKKSWMRRRSNLLELSFSPTFIYINSDSEFYYRRYFLAAPGMSADARVWLHPDFGLNLSYLGTLGGHVSDSSAGSENIAVAQQWLAAGLRSRRFFWWSHSDAALTFGIDYFESQFRVPSDAKTRQHLFTAGVRISLEAELPTTNRHVWLLNFSFAPKLDHREQATGIDFQSGGNVESSSIGAGFGSKYLFDHAHSVFWRLSHTVEKNLFSGSATVNDPATGAKPSGVGVTQSATMFQMGYTWGN